MTQLLLNIDVDDIERARAFYTEAFELEVGRKLGDDFLELRGAEIPIYLLLKASGTAPFDKASSERTYQPHWTPVHFDVVVRDIEAAVARAVNAGATLEQPAERAPYGLLALLRDPFGHGFCLLQFEGRGYDAIAEQ